MPSFDIVSEIDMQKLDNAINVAVKEITNRYDFHGSKTTLELDKKTLMLQIITENEMRMKAVQDVIIGRMVKQGLEPSALDYGKEHYASGNMIRNRAVPSDQGTAARGLRLLLAQRLPLHR